METNNQLTEGDDVEIICAASLYNYTRVDWLNNMDDAAVETGRILNEYQRNVKPVWSVTSCIDCEDNNKKIVKITERISITNSSTNFTHRATLRIKNVRKSDNDSYYVCSATNAYDEIERSGYKLRIHGKQHIHINTLSISLTAKVLQKRDI